jgi:hypothetical protein
MRALLLSAIWWSFEISPKSHATAFLHSSTFHHRRLRRAAGSTTKQTLDNQKSSETVYDRSISWNAREKCWRPTVSDVERISWGKPAKKKGTGSRGVPHRLNDDEERLLFDQARRKGFLEVAGSGWRSQRREAPLINSYRSLCDARGQVCIVLHKGNTGVDEVVLDLSPLRLPETFHRLEMEVIDFVNMPTSYKPSEDESPLTIDESNLEDETNIDTPDDPWNSRPIYQLPTFCISWETARSDAKELCKKLAIEFGTIEKNVLKSKKPNHVSAGKSRRHGGYGIG